MRKKLRVRGTRASPVNIEQGERGARKSGARLVAQQVQEGRLRSLQQAEKGGRVHIYAVVQRRLDALQQLPVVDLLRHPAGTETAGPNSLRVGGSGGGRSAS